MYKYKKLVIFAKKNRISTGALVVIYIKYISKLHFSLLSYTFHTKIQLIYTQRSDSCIRLPGIIQSTVLRSRTYPLLVSTAFFVLCFTVIYMLYIIIL